MGTIKNRFIYYKNYDNFLRDLNSNIIAEDSIVFIEDSNIIWTSGHEYTCSPVEDSSAFKKIRETIEKLMPIAFSGSYNDLKDKPEIPEIPEIPQITIDSELSSTSTNPVSNKAIWEALQKKANVGEAGGTFDSALLEEYLKKKQDILKAGYGISISEDNTISVIGNFVTSQTFEQHLNQFGNKFVTLEYIEENFVNWIDVYTDGKTGSTKPTPDDDVTGGSGSTISPEVLADIQNLKLNVNYLLNQLKSVAYTAEYADLLNLPTIPTVDKELSATSTNAIANNAVYAALQQKATKTELDTIFNSSKFTTAMRNKQDVLTAGKGISIKDGVISTTLDVNVFEIVDSLGSVIAPNNSKIYLVRSEDGSTFEQWMWKSGEWYSLGSIAQDIDLTEYYTKTQIKELFYTKNQTEEYVENKLKPYYTKEDIDNMGFLQGGSIDQFFTEEKFNLALKNYVNWSQVYAQEESESRPGGGIFDDVYDDNTNDIPKEITDAISRINTRLDYLWDQLSAVAYSGEYMDLLGRPKIPTTDLELNQASRNPLANETIYNELHKKQDALRAGNGIIIRNGVISASAASLVTLTAKDYQNLVDTDMIEEDVYYFTYNEESDVFTFGGQFPIKLS